MFEYIILVAVVAAGLSGIIITKNMFGSNQIHGKLKNRYLEYIADLENDNKKLNGKLNQMKKGITINKDEFDESNPMGSIGSLINQISPMLPASIRPLLNDPKSMNYISKLVQDNPEKIAELIGKFVKSPKIKNETPNNDMESV